MSDGFEWYCSCDQESWKVIDAADRWEAVQYVLRNGDFDGDWICQASKPAFPYEDLFDIDDIDCRMTEDDCGEKWGEHQDSIFSEDPTREQKRDLEKRLIKTFKNWVQEHKIELEVPWCFDEMKDVEQIDIENYCWVWTTYQGRIFNFWSDHE